MKQFWYAIYTRPRFEKKIADALTLIGFENYCPLNKVTKQWSDRKKVIEEPFFASYVFVRANEKQHLAIRKINGVLNFVYWLNKPAVIPDHEIDTVKQFLKEFSDVKVEQNSVRVKDAVRITDGAFSNMTGSVLLVNKKTIKVSLPTLQCTLIAEIKRDSIEVINEKFAVSNNSSTFFY